MNRAFHIKKNGLFIPDICRINPAFLGSFPKPVSGGGGGSGWTKIASVSEKSTDGNGLTTGQINTSGATLIVMMVAWYGTRPSVSDSAGNTYTLGPTGDSLDNTFGSDSQVALFYCAAPTTSSTHTFTVTGLVYPTVVVYAFSGGAGGILDQTNNGLLIGGGTTFQAGSITPTTSNQLIITGVNSRTQVPTGIDSGFATPITITFQTFNDGAGASYLVQGAAAAVNPTWTLSGNDFASAVVASFK